MPCSMEVAHFIIIIIIGNQRVPVLASIVSGMKLIFCDQQWPSFHMRAQQIAEAWTVCYLQKQYSAGSYPIKNALK